jgi:endoglucanase
MNTSRLVYSLVLGGVVAGVAACEMDRKPRAAGRADGAESRNVVGSVQAGAAPGSSAAGAGTAGEAGGGAATASSAGTAADAGAAGAPGAAGATSVGSDGGSPPDVPPTLQRCASTLEAEQMVPSTGELAEGGWNLDTAGTLSGSHDFTGGDTTITVQAKGAAAGGEWPHMVVRAGDQTAGEADVTTDAWSAYAFTFRAPAGTHDIGVEFSDDGLSAVHERRLYVDKVDVDEFCEPVMDPGGSDSDGPVAGINPFAGASLYVDPRLQAAQSGIAKIASNPVAFWIGPWHADPAGVVRGALEASGSQLRVLVAYNIYDRNCSGGSSGNVGNAEQYGDWIASVASGIGDHEVVVILEPDTLGHTCDPSRTQALADAVTTLKSNPNAHVYIDAGHAGWVDADTMASRLVEAGIANADGFSLNVGDFETTAASIDYGVAISGAVGGKPFVIDTSRNGRGPAGSEWCNPPDRGLGEQPTANTGNERVHAFLWIKSPGESDGECNGGPPAGDWFPSYAETLAANAVF